MNPSPMSRVRVTSRRPVAAVAVLALLAVALSGYMWFESVRLHSQGYQAGVMLCPETELVNCREVLLSRYAQWLGIPVAGVGLANYLALLTVGLGLLAAGSNGSRRFFWTTGVALAMLGTGAGLWLLWVQLVRLHTICYLCDIVHVCGLVSLILLVRARPVGQTMGSAAAGYAGALGLAAAGLAVLVAGQLLVRPQIKGGMLVVATQPAAQTQSAATQAAATQTQPANGFVVRDAAGTPIAVLDLDKEIVLGDPTAERTVIELLDFGCHECKHEMGLMQEIWKKYPRWFRVICLMYPNNRECNKYAGGMRAHVCDVAQVALAVHKHVPDKYLTVQDTLYRLQGPTLTGGLAWQVARELCQVEDATLEEWQADESLLETVKQHCDLGVRLQAGAAKPGLPTLYAEGMVFCGSDETLKDLEDKLTKLVGPPDGPARVAGAVATAPASQAASSPASRQVKTSVRSPGPILLGR